MKIDIIDVSANKKKIRVTIVHHGHSFTGVARVNPEDEKCKSELFGGRIAESRAIKKAFEYDLKKAKEEYKEIKKFVKACELTKKFNSEEVSAKVMYHQFNVKKKQVEKLKKQIQLIEEGIQRQITQRFSTLEKMSKTKEEENK